MMENSTVLELKLGRQVKSTYIQLARKERKKKREDGNEGRKAVDSIVNVLDKAVD
jgi:hypothetical protein